MYNLSPTVIFRDGNEVMNTHALIDDDLLTMKEKVFLSTKGIKYHPRFTKFDVIYTNTNTNTTSITLWNGAMTLFDILDNNTANTYSIQVSNVWDYIDDTEILSSLRTNPNDALIQGIHAMFEDLTDDDLDFVVSYKWSLVNNLPIESDDKSKADEFLQTRSKLQALDKYNDIYENEVVGAFFEDAKQLDLAKSLYDASKLSFLNVTLTVQSKDFETGMKGRFINLEKVFNLMELGNEIPFVTHSSSTLSEPVIKIHNRLLNIINEKDVRLWVLNEKKKANTVSYKKVRGIMFKYQIIDNTFMTINLLDNGTLTLKVSDYLDATLDQIVDIIARGVDRVVETINALPGVFTQAKKLSLFVNSQSRIDSITASIPTIGHINLLEFQKILYSPYVSSYLFELKDTLSADVVSMYYKKAEPQSSDDTTMESERKGMTVNMRDNPTNLDSTVINIYGARNMHQINAIIQQIHVLNNVQTAQTPTRAQVNQKRKLKNKSQIKILNEGGIKISSKECQKKRQPIVGDNSNPESYTLEYKGKTFTCPTTEYPFPGFLENNLPCCFQNNQKGRDPYLRNMYPNEFDIYIQPSNFKVRVFDEDTNTPFETFAIKVVSDYISGFDESNALSRYYFISKDKTLLPINDSNLIQEIEIEEQEHDIWLDSISFAKTIADQPKNKCAFPPKKNVGDINEMCAHHETNKYFGYNLSSNPCCFDKPKNKYITGKKIKASNPTKQHILQEDKLTGYKRLGYLPKTLDALIHDTLGMKGQFYRMGVLQNTNAFLNAITLIAQNSPKLELERSVNSLYELKSFLINQLKSTPDLFLQLNKGNVSAKYESLENYIETMLDAIVPPSDVIDLVHKVLKVNIIILDVPYNISKSSKLAEYDKMKIVCHHNVVQNKDFPYLVLLKKIKAYELLVKVSTTNQVQYLFEYTQDNIANFLVQYYYASCVKDDVYPENFAFTKLLSISSAIALIDNTKHAIESQIVNTHNKVDFVQTKSKALIPIRETGIIDGLKVTTMAELLESNGVLDFKETLQTYIDMNVLMKNQIGILGVTVDSGQVTAVMTAYGVLVPVAKGQAYTLDLNLDKLPFKYYANSFDTMTNEQIAYTEENTSIQKEIYDTKKTLANYINEHDTEKERIISVAIDPIKSKFAKISTIASFFQSYLLALQYNSKTHYLMYIANEVVNDNKENLLLNNIVTSELFNLNEVVKRTDESVLLNIEDIKQWIKKYNPQA